MDLVANVGNTRCRLAAWDGPAVLGRGEILATASPFEVERALDALVASLPGRPLRFALASVNPGLAGTVMDWARFRLGLEPRVLKESLAVPIPVEVDEPERVGADRLANAVYAARRHPGRAVLVADFGTAASFSVVSPRGAFLGGAIAPGLALAARALASGTAQLPRVDVAAVPSRAIGRSTLAAIQSGVLFSAAGLVRELARRVRSELSVEPLVLATGGDAALVASACDPIREVLPDLTLEGVRIALEEAPDPGQPHAPAR